MKKRAIIDMYIVYDERIDEYMNYTDSNHEIKSYYEYQKAFITAKKELDKRFVDRSQELNSIKTSLYNRDRNRVGAMRESAKKVAPPVKSVPKQTRVTSNYQCSQTKVEPIINNTPMEDKPAKPLMQTIKKFFSKGKTAISNLFSDVRKSSSVPAKSNIPVNDNFVSPELKNNTGSSKPYYRQSNLDYLRYNNKVSNSSSIDRVSQVNSISTTSQSYRNSSHIDSLAFARYLKDEDARKSFNSSSHVDSLEFARLLKEDKKFQSNNYGRRSSREIEER